MQNKIQLEPYVECKKCKIVGNKIELKSFFQQFAKSAVNIFCKLGIEMLQVIFWVP